MKRIERMSCAGLPAGKRLLILASLSKLFIPTFARPRQMPEVASHKFLVRSGYIRQLGAGHL